MQQPFTPTTPFNEILTSINIAIINGSIKSYADLTKMIVCAEHQQVLTQEQTQCIIGCYELDKLAYRLQNNDTYYKTMKKHFDKLKCCKLVNLTIYKRYITPFDYLVIMTIAQNKYNYAFSIIDANLKANNIDVLQVLKDNNHTIESFKTFINNI